MGAYTTEFRTSNFEVRTTGKIGAARFSLMSAKEIWRIDEGQVIIPADRIRNHALTELIYGICYSGGDIRKLWNNL